MKEEIIQKILDAPLSAWSSSHTLMLEGVKIDLVRSDPGGGCPCIYLDIEGVIINDKRLRGLYYDLYERKTTTLPEEEQLTPIYNKLCKK